MLFLVKGLSWQILLSLVISAQFSLSKLQMFSMYCYQNVLVFVSFFYTADGCSKGKTNLLPGLKCGGVMLVKCRV